MHRLESGSKLKQMLAWAGGTVELKENHSHTRDRWTANTTVTTDIARASELPHVEFMARGGPGVAQQLIAAVDNLASSGEFGNLAVLSTQTSPRDSYAAAEMDELFETSSAATRRDS